MSVQAQWEDQWSIVSMTGDEYDWNLKNDQPEPLPQIVRLGSPPLFNPTFSMEALEKFLCDLAQDRVEALAGHKYCHYCNGADVLDIGLRLLTVVVKRDDSALDDSAYGMEAKPVCETCAGIYRCRSCLNIADEGLLHLCRQCGYATCPLCEQEPHKSACNNEIESNQ